MGSTQLEYFFTSTLKIKKERYNSISEKLYSILQTTVLDTLTNVYYMRNVKLEKDDISPPIIFEWLYDPYVINSLVLNLLFSKKLNKQDKLMIIKAFFKHHLRGLKIMRLSARAFSDISMGFPTITLFYPIYKKKRYNEKIIKTALKYDSLTNYHLPTLKKYFLNTLKQNNVSEELKLKFLLSISSRLEINKEQLKRGEKTFLQTALLAFYAEKTISVDLLLSLTKELTFLLSMPKEMALVLSIDKKTAKKDFPLLVRNQPWFMNADSWNVLLANFGALFPSLVFEIFTRIDDEEQKARLLLELGIIGTLPKSLFLSTYLDILSIIKPVYSKEVLSIILQSLLQRIGVSEKKALLKFGYTELDDKTFVELGLKDKSSEIREFTQMLIKRPKKEERDVK